MNVALPRGLLLYLADPASDTAGRVSLPDTTSPHLPNLPDSLPSFPTLVLTTPLNISAWRVGLHDETQSTSPTDPDSDPTSYLIQP